ncbi:uncharacterized protein [Cicer arietinum]
MASELNLNMRSDGYVNVNDLLKLNLKTFANIPLRSHTIDDIREAVRKDNKQRFNLIEENGELLIRANQGHTTTAVETESLLKPILSDEGFPVCVHGTYRRNLDSILASGLKRMKRLHVHFSCGLPTDGEVISGNVIYIIEKNPIYLWKSLNLDIFYFFIMVRQVDFLSGILRIVVGFIIGMMKKTDWCESLYYNLALNQMWNPKALFES